MRHVAAVPAIALLSGAAAGLLVPDLPRALLYVVLTLATIGAAWACWRVRRGVLVAAVVALFVAGGALLAIDAWQRAWRPPLRAAFESLARAQRAQAAAEGRRLPEDDEAFATVAGMLRADGSPTESGVSLSLDVDVVDDHATAGGIVVTVAGALAADRAGEWRA